MYISNTFSINIIFRIINSICMSFDTFRSPTCKLKLSKKNNNRYSFSTIVMTLSVSLILKCHKHDPTLLSNIVYAFSYKILPIYVHRTHIHAAEVSLSGSVFPKLKYVTCPLPVLYWATESWDKNQSPPVNWYCWFSFFCHHCVCFRVCGIFTLCLRALSNTWIHCWSNCDTDPAWGTVLSISQAKITLQHSSPITC